MEAWISQLSFAGLMLSNSVSQRSNPVRQLFPQLPDLLQKALAESLDQSPNPQVDASSVDPIQLINAVAQAAKGRMESFAAGVARYHAHGFHRQMELPPPVWQQGAATLRDYGGTGPAVLVVPSLINRSTILDLAPDRSLLRTMAAADLHTFLLDWGYPGEFERTLTVEKYICDVLIPAVIEVVRRTGMPVRLVGYCMGGTLAVAPAVLIPQGIAALVAVATPWDFHVGTAALRAFITAIRPALEATIAMHGEAPFDLLQALFATLDPTLVGRKFRRFAMLDPTTEEARRFVELEDWLNDPVPLTAAVARECLFSWYGDNAPARGQWRVADTVIDPSRIACRSLALIPSRDRIVPPESAQTLGRALPNAEIRTVPLGHIGMMASGRAHEVTYQPLIAWLREA